MPTPVKLLLAGLATAVLAACSASNSQRTPVPELQVEAATAKITGASSAGLVRLWGDEKPAWFDDFISQPSSELKAIAPEIFGKPHSYLALSGGGENGAFGAGLLNGWTATGDRPQFTFVTGISTGSLIAPFAFLGPAHDTSLREIYTQYSTKDLLRKKPLPSILSSDSAVDSSPLRGLIEKYVDATIIAAIAAEHRKGRRLWIGTTNLDAGRPVIWNIGEIANSNDPRAPSLIHDILLASASIPGAFPPVLINVEANGRTFDELHVDGGTSTQVFFYPVGVDWKKVLRKMKVPGKPDLFVIRNAAIDPTYKATERKIMPIASRSIETLVRTQGIGDLYRIYLGAVRDGIEFHLAYVPDDFNVRSNEEFDPVYMRALYNTGYDLALSGKMWHDKPPAN
jgi:predicted patatin/cPLA2 family phospholipase